jgi:thiamine-phosphate pyrophosphorylase
MDRRLVGWARAVKARRRACGLPSVPPLWLFTDARRLADPRAAARRLPLGLCGIVVRHDGAPCRDALIADLAAICAARRLWLAVAGDWRVALRHRAMPHLRNGHWAPARRRGQPATSSAHDAASLRRAARNGAIIAFLSPIFPTESHPGAPALGAVRWAALARAHGGKLRICALGGVDATSIRRVAPDAAGIGAIGALR